METVELQGGKVFYLKLVGRSEATPLRCHTAEDTTVCFSPPFMSQFIHSFMASALPSITSIDDFHNSGQWVRQSHQV